MSGYDAFLKLLKKGEKNAQRGEDLARRLDTTPRMIRRFVAEARKCGVLVCSTDKGYFMAANRDELRRSYLRMKAQAQSTLDALKATKRALSDFEGQEELEFGDEPEEEKQS